MSDNCKSCGISLWDEVGVVDGMTCFYCHLAYEAAIEEVISSDDIDEQ